MEGEEERRRERKREEERGAERKREEERRERKREEQRAGALGMPVWEAEVEYAQASCERKMR